MVVRSVTWLALISLVGAGYLLVRRARCWKNQKDPTQAEPLRPYLLSPPARDPKHRENRPVRERAQNWKPPDRTAIEDFGRVFGSSNSELQRRSKHVAAFSIAIARTLGLSREEIGVIARGAFLCDIGMPGAILRKTGALTPEEIAAMRQHCYRGCEMLEKHPDLSDAAEIVYSHEEWFDGTGYPRGLKGDDIPLGARIVSVADILDALAFAPPQSRRQSLQETRQEISHRSGRQFDPKIVEVFLTLPENIWGDLCAEIGSSPSY